MFKKLAQYFFRNNYQTQLDMFINRHNPKSEAEINKLIHKFSRSAFI